MAKKKKKGGYRLLTFTRYDVTNVIRKQLGVSQRRRLILWERDPHCVWCGVSFEHPEDATIEHLLPSEFGGTYAQSNLRLACKGCNGERNRFYQRFFQSRRDGNEPERTIYAIV